MQEDTTMGWIEILKRIITILLPFIKNKTQDAIMHNEEINDKDLKTFHRKLRGLKVDVVMNEDVYRMLKKITFESQANGSNITEYYDYLKVLSDSYIRHSNEIVEEEMRKIRTNVLDETMADLTGKERRNQVETLGEYEYYSEVISSCMNDAYDYIMLSNNNSKLLEVKDIAHYRDHASIEKVAIWISRIETIKKEILNETMALFHGRHFSSSVVYSNSLVKIKLSGYGTVRESSKVINTIFESYVYNSNRIFRDDELIQICIKKGSRNLRFEVPKVAISNKTIIDIIDVEFIHGSISNGISLIDYIRRAYGDEDSNSTIEIIAKKDQRHDLSGLEYVSDSVFEIKII